MKYRLLPFVLFLASASTYGQAALVVPPAATPPREEILNHWRRATVALGTVVQDGARQQFVTQGSAVIVSIDAHRGCILTAKHMLVNPDTGMVTQQLWMRYPSVEGEEEPYIPLGLFDATGANVWRASADGADLAIIPMPPLAMQKKRIDSVGIQDFANPESDVFQGAVVLVLGYPQIVGEAYLSTPIARNGIIAWVDPSAPAERVFLVDANLYNGNSGGPVFRVKNGTDKFGNINFGGGLSLLGIVSRGPLQNAPVVSADGYVYHENPVTHKQTQEAAIVANVGGIGIIEPISKARTLLDSVFADPLLIPAIKPAPPLLPKK